MKREFAWFINDIPHGVSFVGSDRMTLSPRTVPAAEHWFCPYCGRVWAKRLPISPDPIRHQFLSIPCSTCGLTGSLNLTSEMVRQAPREVLEYETLKAYEHPDDWVVYSYAKKPKTETETGESK